MSREPYAVSRAKHRIAACIAVVAACVCTPSALAQELTVQPPAPVPTPSELAEPIRTLLSDAAVTVRRGDNMLEFWWVKNLPVGSAGGVTAPAWSAVPAGALVGALRIAGPLTDIRGLPMKPGVYTLRYALQPQDGDHTGVSPFREFLLVAPAAEDASGEPAGYKGAVALARKTTGKSHPSALSLDPPAAAGAPGTVLTNEAGHKAVLFTVPATSGGAPAGTLTFGLILVGTIEHQM